MLTPLGDPPLFLGYLQGVPFAWTFRLWPHWLTSMASPLLVIYFVWDSRAVRARAARGPSPGPRAARAAPPPGRGQRALAGRPGPGCRVPGAGAPAGGRDRGAGGTLALDDLRRRPAAPIGFTTYPIVEVAVLFFGIFLTMIPALELLRTRGAELGRAASRGSSSGRPARCRRSSTMRRPISPFSPSAKACGLGERGGGRPPRHSGRDQRGRRRHGRQHLHRERAELHGQVDRRGGRRQDAELLRLPALQRRSS